MINIDRSKWNMKSVSENKNFTMLKRQVQVKAKDMSDDLFSKCTEKIQNAVDKYLTEGVDATNFEVAAKAVKEDMEKENGPTWICIIGQAFAFNVNSQKEAFLYCYLGEFGVLLYKC